MLIEFDLIEYLKNTSDKAVKKTLTIPSWFNNLAEQNKDKIRKVAKLINQCNAYNRDELGIAYINISWLKGQCNMMNTVAGVKWHYLPK